MCNPGALSRLRLACDTSPSQDKIINNVSEDAVCYALSDSCSQPNETRQYRSDWGTARFVQVSGPTARSAKSLFLRVRQALKEDDGCLLLGSRLNVPVRLRRDMFDSAHELHTGHTVDCKNVCRACVWWPGLKQDVQRWIQDCRECSLLRPRLGKDVASWPTARPLERIYTE